MLFSIFEEEAVVLSLLGFVLRDLDRDLENDFVGGLLKGDDFLFRENEP